MLDLNSGQLYGHLIALDVLGDGYVVPSLATLHDICGTLGAVSASWASPEDVLSEFNSRLPLVRHAGSGFSDLHSPAVTTERLRKGDAAASRQTSYKGKSERMEPWSFDANKYDVPSLHW